MTATRTLILLIPLLMLSAGRARAEEESLRPLGYGEYHYANDAALGTDRDYTQGMEFLLFLPVLEAWPVFWLLPEAPGSDARDTGLAIRWPGYTPDDIESPFIVEDERPYSTVLHLSHILRSYDEEWRLFVESELKTGVIGPVGSGEDVQKAIHRAIDANEPKGWRHEIRHDLVLDLQVTARKVLWEPWSWAQLLGHADASLGTLSTHAALGGGLRLGLFETTTPGMVFARGASQLFLFGQGELRAVGYNATLQGGLFNRHSPHTIPAGDIERLVPRFEFGLQGTAGPVQLRAFVVAIGREFREGEPHAWLQLDLAFAF